MNIVNTVSVESVLPTNVSVNSTDAYRVFVTHNIEPVTISVARPDEPLVSPVVISVAQPVNPISVSVFNLQNAINVEVAANQVQAVRVIVSGNGPPGAQGPPGAPGEPGVSGDIVETFESVSKNLKGFPAVLNYTLGELTSITYTTESGTITKTLNYTGDNLTSIVLSGDTPAGIELTKTLNYTGDILTSISYS